MNRWKSAIIFGGAGFIGFHLSKYLLENGIVDNIICLDIIPPKYNHSKIKYIYCDVRMPVNIDIDNADVIYNLAAIHRTPGHSKNEYFETNVLGAKNVCNFAERKDINKIVFTSSISFYGSSEELKTEDSIPQPFNAYGISKLIAEYIHKEWMLKDTRRKLIILRPGIVFGKWENGNFTRLYNSLKKGYFFYPGRKDTKKACIYVKDLVRAMVEMVKNNERFQLYNMCYPEAPTIETIVKVISEITGLSKNRIVAPGFMLKIIAFIFKEISNITKNASGIHPDRVDKLIVSTNISGEKLAKSSYKIKFSLEDAIKDWYNDCDCRGLY